VVLPRRDAQPGAEPPQATQVVAGDERPRKPTPLATATPTPTPDPNPIETVDVDAVLETAAALGDLIPTATPTELPAVLTAWAEQGTVLPTETPVPPTPTPTLTPSPTPTMTGEEQAFVEERQHFGSQSASSPDECSEILKTEPWCAVTTYAKYITRPEWEALFPEARFLLERYDLHGGRHVQRKTLLFIEQGGQRYRPDDFKRLMAMNGVVVTEENRELVARALVLTRLSDHLWAEIRFSDAGETDKRGTARFQQYNYTITSWSQIQGIKVRWYFAFYGGNSLYASGAVIERCSGEYIDVPDEELFLTNSDPDLEYEGF
jgi:hypothetical protein